MVAALLPSFGGSLGTGRQGLVAKKGAASDLEISCEGDAARDKIVVRIANRSDLVKLLFRYRTNFKVRVWDGSGSVVWDDRIAKDGIVFSPPGLSSWQTLRSGDDIGFSLSFYRKKGQVLSPGCVIEVEYFYFDGWGLFQSDADHGTMWLKRELERDGAEVIHEFVVKGVVRRRT